MAKNKNVQRLCMFCKYENAPHRRTVFQEPCKSCFKHSNFEEFEPQKGASDDG